VAKWHWFVPQIFGFAAVALAISLPNSGVQATEIDKWNFDRARNQLTFSTDEDVQPTARLLANPTRVVVDLPGVTLGHPSTKHPIGTPTVQEIRFGQFDTGTTRVVIALNPGYSLDPKQIRIVGDAATRWRVELPSAQPAVSAINPLESPEGIPLSVTAPKVVASVPTFTPGTKFGGAVALNAPMDGLRGQVKSLMSRYSFLQTGMFFLDLDTGDYLDIRGDKVFSAASTIKLPVLIAYLQALDAGQVDLKETLVMREALVAEGSGTMQDSPVGSRYSSLHTLTQMIAISDNTATNMIIDRLGGIARVNQQFRSWGLKDTRIRNWLGDFSGTNTTSPQELAQLLAMVSQNQLLSPRSRQLALDILLQCHTRSLLPPGLGPGATIAHKTGDIGFLIGDAGLVTMPNGKRYLASIFVNRPYDDARGRDFIQQVSRLVYNHLARANTMAGTGGQVGADRRWPTGNR
jgi:beta-lactamase class A